MPLKTADHFSIALICALPIEANAVLALFDETDHQSYGNSYSTGRVGQHNVVVAHMPGMGKVSAAGTTSRLVNTFKSVMLAIVVGICGGVPFTPDKTEILLGDVIISDSIIEYDFGGQYPDGFKRKSGTQPTLPRSHQDARSFITKLKTPRMHNQVWKQALRHLEYLQNGFSKQYHYPGASHDLLFEASYRHKHHLLDTSPVCVCNGCDTSIAPVCNDALKSNCSMLGCSGKLLKRERLSADNPRPFIHMGTMASADTVMKSGEHRDILAQEDGAIGFEMEGAGVRDHVPCIIIKGVCDYADSHKSKSWQNYAAATAASYTKAFLEHYIPATQEYYDTPLMSLSNFASHFACSDEEQRTAVLNWLPAKDFSQVHIDNLQVRVEGTGSWFFECSKFQDWYRRSSGLLWCSGKPGSGKTMLSSITIDYIQRNLDEHTGVCYFFFSYRDEKLDIFEIIATLLSQLIGCEKGISKDIVKLNKLCSSQKRQPSLEEYSAAFALQVSRFHKVFIVLDALDECSDELRTVLHFEFMKVRSQINLIVMSRDLKELAMDFENCLHMNVVAHTEDIKHYIEYKIHYGRWLRALVEREDSLKTEIINTVSGQSDGMFLLVRLWMDELAKKTSLRSIDHTLRNFPKDLDTVYKEMVSRIFCQDGDRPDLARRVLSWLCYSRRSLTIEELQHALAVHKNDRSFSRRGLVAPFLLESVCLGMVVVDHLSNTVHFMSKTFQDYYEKVASQHFPEALTYITSICITYLSFDECTPELGVYREKLKELGQNQPFFDYAACYWAIHAAGIPERSLLKDIVKFLEIPSKLWYHRYLDFDFILHNPVVKWEHFLSRPIGKIYIAASLGLVHVVQYYIKQGSDIEWSDCHGVTAVWQAACRGHPDVVQILLDRGADIERRDIAGDTLLHWALAPSMQCISHSFSNISFSGNARAMIGPSADVKSLLHYKSYLRGKLTQTILHKLVDKVQFVDAQDSLSRTPLSLAVQNGYWQAVLRFMKKGSHLLLRDADGLTPFVHALQYPRYQITFSNLMISDHAKVVCGACLKIDTDILRSSRDTDTLADESTIASLLGDRFDPNIVDGNGRTTLALAVENRYLSLVKVLLQRGVDVNTPDVQGITPLMLASRPPQFIKTYFRNITISGNSKVILGNTYTVYYSLKDLSIDSLKLKQSTKQETIVKLLLDAGAAIEATDIEGKTALEFAAESHLSSIVRLLVTRGALVKSEVVKMMMPLNKERDFDKFIEVSLKEHLVELVFTETYFSRKFMPTIFIINEGHDYRNIGCYEYGSMSLGDVYAFIPKESEANEIHRVKERIQEDLRETYNWLNSVSS